jgi:hypothetical protein
MKGLLLLAGERGCVRFIAMLLSAMVVLSLTGGCSKAPPVMDQKAVAGDDISVAMYRHYGWQLVSTTREDEISTIYLFQRPENFQQSVQDAIAEAGAEAKDKARLADKELSEVEKTDGKE